MEAVPLPDGSTDVIISNCVVNLSPDKPAVFREAFRVLKPGGRLAISDIVLRRALPEPVQRAMGLWTGCVAGALLEDAYQEQLAKAWLREDRHRTYYVFDRSDIIRMAGDLFASGDMLETLDVEATTAALDGAVMSAFVRASKPGDGTPDRWTCSSQSVRKTTTDFTPLTWAFGRGKSLCSDDLYAKPRRGGPRSVTSGIAQRPFDLGFLWR